MDIEFTASLVSAVSGFVIDWGDTVRIRDEYNPYFVLEVSVLKDPTSRLAALRSILLYSFKGYWADVHDNLNEEAFIRESRFGALAAGSILRVGGPLFRKHPRNRGEIFRAYSHVIVRPELVGGETHPDGSSTAPPTTWLIEEGEVPEAELSAISHLLVAWRCADVL
jgi:hypothetical protein